MAKRWVRRRRGRRRRRWRRKRSSGSSSLPLPKVMKFKSRYFESGLSLDPGVGGTLASYLFSCNGIYDSNITSTGHQCIGFDQVMPFYDHYRVIGARIKATCVNNDTTLPIIFGIKVQDNTVVSETDIGVLIENGLNKYTTIAPQGSGPNVKTLTLNWSAKSYFGKSCFGDNDYRGTISSNPDEQAYFRLMVQPTQASDASAARVMVEIEYIALLTERKNLAQS